MFPQIFPCWLKVNFFFLYFDFRFSFFDWLKVTFFTHRYTELNRLSVMLIPLASWRLVWKSVRIALSAYADRRIVLFFRNADFVVRAWITKHTSAFPAMAKESILDLTVKIMKIVKIPYREMFMQWSSFKNLNHLLVTKENLSSYNRENKSKKKKFMKLTDNGAFYTSKRTWSHNSNTAVSRDQVSNESVPRHRTALVPRLLRCWCWKVRSVHRSSNSPRIAWVILKKKWKKNNENLIK